MCTKVKRLGLYVVGFIGGLWFALAAINLTAEAEGASSWKFEALSDGERILQSKTYVRPDQPTVYLSFDDGPSELTPQVLDILQEENVKATFFVLGQAAEQHPDLIRQMVREGHAVGNHTYNHDYGDLYGSFEAFWRQVSRTQRILQETADIQSRLFRTPGGTHPHFDPFYFYYLDQAGYEIHDWNMDSGDSSRIGVPADEIIQNIRRGPFKHEVHLLMHDSKGHKESVKALRQTIRLFKDKGYRFAALTEQVKPVHQSPGQPRQERTYTHSSHQAMMDEIIGSRSVSTPSESHDEPIPMPSQDRSVVETAGGQAPYTPPSLTINMPERQLTFTDQEHQLIQGRLYVSLREWSERRGGDVTWVQEEKSAYEKFGDRTWKWDVKTGQVHLIQKGETSEWTKENIGFIVEDGRIYVPLRDVLPLYGQKVSAVKIGIEKRDVTVT